MNPLEIEAQGAILLNQAEVKAAEIGEILAQLNALGTAEFEANYDAGKVDAANRKYDAAAAATARLKARLASYHLALQAAQATATFPRPRSGK